MNHKQCTLDMTSYVNIVPDPSTHLPDGRPKWAGYKRLPPELYPKANNDSIKKDLEQLAELRQRQGKKKQATYLKEFAWRMKDL